MHKLKDWEIMDVFHTRRQPRSQGLYPGLGAALESIAAKPANGISRMNLFGS